LSQIQSTYLYIYITLKISVFHGLKKYYDYLTGETTRPQDSDLIFPDQELAKRRSGIREEFVLKKSVNKSPESNK
jgi:hypothetical protein